MSTEPVVVSSGANPEAPLVVLLHGRGSNEQDLFGLVQHLETGPEFVSVRGPLGWGPGFTWFESQQTARPIPEVFEESMAWFRKWLDGVAPSGRKVVLIGFSAGAVMAGGLVLADSQRFSGLALLSGPLPLEHLVPGALLGMPVFSEQGQFDEMIPKELFDRTLYYLLNESGAIVESRQDPIAHEVSAEELAALKDWVVRAVA